MRTNLEGVCAPPPPGSLPLPPATGTRFVRPFPRYTVLLVHHTPYPLHTGCWMGGVREQRL